MNLFKTQYRVLGIKAEFYPQVKVYFVLPFINLGWQYYTYSGSTGDLEVSFPTLEEAFEFIGGIELPPKQVIYPYPNLGGPPID